MSLYSGLLSFGYATYQGFDFFLALGCCVRISFGAVFPALVFMLLTTKQAPSDLRSMVGFGWISAACLISIVSQLNCPIDDVAHVLVGHGLLLVVLGIVVYFVLHPLARYLAQKSVRNRLGPLAKKLKTPLFQ